MTLREAASFFGLIFRYVIAAAIVSPGNTGAMKIFRSPAVSRS
jgi:hypothetical protein